ncbi:class I SAM-dependent methyltransferase [Arcanobacterium hippocoleae]|uniref:class I SAM-dependent methyltransferase n=1 Tax=Arcanobacterium hippocoleae TaxID=149017 RepID=UPI00334105BD
MAKNPYELITDGAQAYLDVRPGYPDELVAALDIYQGVKVADIGAGTGKLTAQICSRTAQVWAVEPSAEMESAFFQALPDFPRSRFVSARAENTGFSRREFDIVSYGQCWHWLDAPAASREAARILRANGKIAIFCNQLNVSIPWVLQLTRIMRSGISKKSQSRRSLREILGNCS